jgi:4-hydroxy-tetrahydrodipicolinate synthase
VTRPELLTAVPTPFDAAERLDEAAFAALLHRLDRAGVDGVFVAGTTGEFTALDDDERLALVGIALDVLGPDRVVAHVGAASARQAERLAARAVERGARRLAAVTPFFQPAPAGPLVDYYRRTARAAGGAALYAYLFRDRTTTTTPPELLARLAAAGVGGVKISGEDDAAVAGYLGAVPAGFAVWSGNDASMAWLHGRGGAGVVSGVSSAFPEPFVALRDAIRAGDRAAVARAEERVRDAVRAAHGGSVAHLKRAIELRGLSAGPVRTATARVTGASAAQLRDLADRLQEDPC